MINKILNTKFILLSLGLFLSFFAFTNKASALTYTYDCLGGGQITTDVSISQSTFQAGSSTPFSAMAQATSTCVPLDVEIKVGNNVTPATTIISFSPLNTGGPFPFPTPASVAFTSPSTAGNYAVNFITRVDDQLPIIQNYWYMTNLGAIVGICRLYPPPGDPGYLRAYRDADTEASAAARGVSKVDYTFRIQTDNYPSPYMSTYTATFLPGELEVDLGFSEINHDAGGYCSAIYCEGYMECNNVDIIEYF